MENSNYTEEEMELFARMSRDVHAQEALQQRNELAAVRLREDAAERIEDLEKQIQSCKDTLVKDLAELGIVDSVNRTVVKSNGAKQTRLSKADKEIRVSKVEVLILKFLERNDDSPRALIVKSFKSIESDSRVIQLAFDNLKLSKAAHVVGKSKASKWNIGKVDDSRQDTSNQNNI